MNESWLENRPTNHRSNRSMNIHTKGYGHSCHFGITCKCDTFLVNDYVLMSERNLLFCARFLLYDHVQY